MKKIAVIGANEPMIPFYKQAKALGYHIIGIAYEKGAVCQKYCNKFYPISFTEKDKVLEICRAEKIDGITSFCLESALPTVIYVAQTLGLVSNATECLKRLANKYTMREVLNDADISNPKYALVSKIEDLDSVNIPFPCIVKPVDSGGSQGVTKVENFNEMKDAFTRAMEYSREHHAIIEQFIDGREFSVEYLTHNGKHFNLQITDKVTSGAPYFVELQHHQPANISRNVRQRIRKLVESALTALAVTNSPSHTEVKLNAKGDLYIIETGARLGGDYITSDLTRLSTDYDLVKGTLELITGDFKDPVVSTRHFSGVYFYSTLTPNIKAYIDNQNNHPFIAEAGYFDIETKECKRNGDRNGYFLYQSDHKIVL